MVLSTKGNRIAVLLASCALFFSLFSSAVTGITGHIERGRIEGLADNTNRGLVCLLQRALALTEANATGRTRGDLDAAVRFYKLEIEFLGGRRDCRQSVGPNGSRLAE